MLNGSVLSSFVMTKGFHITATIVVKELLEMINIETMKVEMRFAELHSHVGPRPWLKGPF